MKKTVAVYAIDGGYCEEEMEESAGLHDGREERPIGC